jgi:hypothetical protein
MTQQPTGGPNSPTSGATAPQVDHAWNLLTLTNEWIRHADAKATAALAFIAALSALLYSLVAKLPETSLCVDVLTVFGCIFLFLATIFSGLTLVPRVHDNSIETSNESNLLFFGTITSKWSNQRTIYRDELETLISSPPDLLTGLAFQIHINANIASKKSCWVQWAIRSILAAGLLIALVAALVAK